MYFCWYFDCARSLLVLWSIIVLIGSSLPFHHHHHLLPVASSFIIQPQQQRQQWINHQKHFNGISKKQHETKVLLFVGNHENNNIMTNDDESSSFDKKTTISIDKKKKKERRKGIRLNKVFKATHSRRQADELIRQGRVSVNNDIIENMGYMVQPFSDIVQLDGNLITGWEQINNNSNNNFEYIKYWKPRGIICTTNPSDPFNVISQIINTSSSSNNNNNNKIIKHRIYPVGRLDKDSSGLLLLTSDGEFLQHILRHSTSTSNPITKQYLVQVNHDLQKHHLQQLRDGILITTETRRPSNKKDRMTKTIKTIITTETRRPSANKKITKTIKTITAKTRPCHVELKGPRTCCITLTEGRNRQIRKMMSALGYKVQRLHRIGIGPIIGLDDLKQEGSWKRLNKKEMEWVSQIKGHEIK